MSVNENQTPNPKIEAPYPSSWVDKLVEWIDRLPGPTWMYYVGATLVLALLTSIVLWIDGSVPVGSYGSIEGIFPPFVFYFLGLYHYLTRFGSRSLRAFRPLLEVGDEEIAEIDYRLSKLPRWSGWLSIGLSLFTLPQFFTSGQAFGERTPNTFPPYVVAGFGAAFFGITIFALILRSIRQMQMVRRLHLQATRINLMDLVPVYAFSRLTSRTGMGIILLLILGYVRDPSSITGSYYIVAYILMAIPAIVVFILPVLGMGNRLKEEKSRVLHETNELLRTTGEKLEKNIRADDFSKAPDLSSAIGALIQKREMVEKISTWPWDSGTVRGFASTLLLPILLWVITRLLERFF